MEHNYFVYHKTLIHQLLCRKWGSSDLHIFGVVIFRKCFYICAELHFAFLHFPSFYITLIIHVILCLCIIRVKFTRESTFTQFFKMDV